MRRVVVVVVVALLGTGAGCGDPPVPTINSDAALEASIIHAAPEGFVLQDDSAFDTGPTDLDKAMRDEAAADASDNRAAARVRLQADRFIRGYQRMWLAPEDTQVLLFVYQFDAPSGARAYAKHWSGRFDEPIETRFSPPGIAADSVFAVSKRSNGLTFVEIIATKGAFVVAVELRSNSEDWGEARATTFASAQVQRY